MKVAAITVTTHNPLDESLRGELLEGKPDEQFLWGGAGNGPGTCRGPAPVLTRQLFFKWIKQHLRIKAFFGTSENAVNTQIWIAVSVYVLVAIVKKHLNLPVRLYETLQILSLTFFEQTPLDQLLSRAVTDLDPTDVHNQMNLFD